MTEHENRNTPASHQGQDLLSDFGAGRKQPNTETAPPPPPPSYAETARPEAKATRAPQEEYDETAPAPKKSAPPKKKSTPSPSAAKAKNREDNGKQAKGPSRSSTADPHAPKKEKSKKDAVNLDDTPRSSKPAHKIIPYVLILLALYIGLSLLLNLFCNVDNRLQSAPSQHWMGLVGYYICYGLFGMFGPAVFVLPFLMLNLAFFWKNYIDHKLVIPKVLASLLFMLILSAIIHVICLGADGQENYKLSAAVLLERGVKMSYGGVIGGGLGYAMHACLSMVGTMIVGVCLLLLSLFYFLGMTPQHLINRIRMRRSMRSDRAPSVSEQDAEAARNRAAMNEKIRKMTGKQIHIDDQEAQGAPDGAVEVVTPAQKKTENDKLAPMPLPRLDPGDDSRPFVPSDINRKLQEAEQKQTAEAEAEATPKAVAMPKPAEAEKPVPEINPAKNKDAAVDPIFPKTNEAKQTRRIPKEDRHFDLRNVFIDLDDSNEKMMQPRRHAPIPPEVPLGGSRPAGKSPVAPAASKPTSGATPQKAGMTPPPAVPRPTPARPATASPTASGAVRPAPSLSAVKPTSKPSTERPIFRAAGVSGQKDFGLSNEEFEKLEAGREPLPKAPAKPTAKPASPTPSNIKTASTAPTKAPKAEAPKKYVFPPISYLQPGEPMTEENKAEIQANMNQLADTLASFHVKVQEINYSCGPTVTRYEVILAAGVRVRTIVNLADDIALALRSSGGVRIEAPIPGTNAVGIEVPNKTRSTIYLRDLIESKPFAESKSKLSACLGADIAGQPLIFDIAKMPHLLVAGTTGSGKSVCINCIIMSLLYKVRPDEVKLVLIDPKKVEFSIYKNIPHLMAPVVTTPKDAAGALQAAVEEMERRFELFETVGVRDLKGFNTVTADDPDMPSIPHMVIIIDELADLMMTAKQEVETAICRIAQKARAAGMHLIIGTQRPSADVVTGLIKANVPSSIAFAVKSQVDSRVILDHGGAEALTGRGDMLFVPIGAMRDTRVQGAFVDDKEVEKICEFIRATNGTAQYDEKFIAKLKELAAQCGNKGRNNDDLPVSPDGEKSDDPKYADAVRVAVEEKRISTSLLQRKLEVGYSRAAKLIDRMQAEGIVSPPDGSKPRSILITPEEYFEKFMDNAEGEQ